MAEKKYKHMIPLEEQQPASMERKSKLISLEEAGKILAEKKIFSIVGTHSSEAAMSLIRAAIRVAGRSGSRLNSSTDMRVVKGNVPDDGTQVSSAETVLIETDASFDASPSLPWTSSPVTSRSSSRHRAQVSAWARMRSRTDHYMPASLLDSQFAALEEPGPGEEVLTVSIDAEADQIVEAILEKL